MPTHSPPPEHGPIPPFATPGPPDATILNRIANESDAMARRAPKAPRPALQPLSRAWPTRAAPTGDRRGRPPPCTLSDADRALFRAAIGAEEPGWTTPPDDLATGPDTTPARPAAVAVQRRVDEQRLLAGFRRDPFMLDGEPLDLQPGDALRHRRDGVSLRQLRRLARGDFRIDDELDLHGLNRHEARAALCEFLDRANRLGRTCLRVIHGKGLRSNHAGPVLKHLVDQELRRRDSVLAFVSAPPSAGGTGAVLVLLRRRHTRQLGSTSDDRIDVDPRNDGT